MRKEEGDKVIEQLMVKDYILFESALIDYNTGMSVITGETGAGKSLLIDAIGYLMGNRIQGNIIRKGKEKCILQMVLSKPSPAVCQQLEDNGFEVDDVLIIQRTINQQQKSTIRINQQITTNHFVRQIVSQIVDIHSQQDTFYLMDSSVQLDLLDQYAQTLDLRKKTKEAYHFYHQALQIYSDTKEKQLSVDQLDLYTAQLNEIEELWMPQEEYDQLQNKIQEQSRAQKTIEDLSECIFLLDHENGLSDQLYTFYKKLQSIQTFADSESYIYDAYYQVMEISEQLKKEKDRILQDAENLDQLQDQQYRLKKAIRKYGGSLEAMAQRKQEIMDQIDLILHREDLLEKLKKDLDVKKEAYDTLALELSQKRQRVFKKLSTSLETHFKDLMLEHARFQVACNPKSAGATGIDDIEFQVSMNPGQPFTSLKQSASGGELSRLMLALKVVFHSKEDTQTLIFDEIDTGVSGKVAFKMGEKMHVLSKQYQVLCITHLASVAAWADTHYRVVKEVVGQESQTKVESLNAQQTIDELAMMTSGQISSRSQNAALELKERIQEILHG